MIEWTESARSDFVTIMEFISRDDHETAVLVGQRIRTSVLRLAQFPKIGKPGRRQCTRELVLPGLPFVIIYEVLNEDIRILRLLHTRMLWP